MSTETQDSSGKLSEEEANELVIEHKGWAESIARSVARSWNMDWQLDGLDGAAMEALIFCSRRFQPGLGVPFKGYARKRIHEASTEAARRSRGWRKRRPSSDPEKRAREISVELMNVFPEMREGQLPGGVDLVDEQGARAAIRGLLLGATIIAEHHMLEDGAAENMLDKKKVVEVMGTLDPIHQELLWHVYWEGKSMRQLATEWETDELNVIREHKVLLQHLEKIIEKGRSRQDLKVRPGLRKIAISLGNNPEDGKFNRLLKHRR